MRLRGVDIGFADAENDKERVAESSYLDSLRGTEMPGRWSRRSEIGKLKLEIRKVEFGTKGSDAAGFTCTWPEAGATGVLASGFVC